MATMSLLAPAPFAQFAPISGNRYVADAQGMIYGVPVGTDARDLIGGGCYPMVIAGRNNLTATTDPVVGSDNTQDYAPGSVWVNTANGRAWTCVSAATGAATWALAVVPGVGVEPANNLEQYGSGAGTMLAQGNVFRTNPAAVVNPGTTGNDNVLAVYSLPANSLDGIGNRGLFLSATGTFGNNTNSKQVKLWFNATTAVVGSAITGGTAVCDSGAYTTTGAVQWELNAQVFKYGAAGSNTQKASGSAVVIGASHGGFGAGTSALPQSLTAVESGPILIAVTGNAATLTTDIGLVNCYIDAFN